MKRQRLNRSEKHGRRDRLTKDRDINLDMAQDNNMSNDGDISLNTALNNLSGDLDSGFKAMGGGEGIYNFGDDTLKQNLIEARDMMKSHPDSHLLLKVELDEEPEEDAGLIMMTRAEDFTQFDQVEVEDVDSGKVYTVPRRSVTKIIGKVELQSAPDFSGGGYGGSDEMVGVPQSANVEQAPVQVSDDDQA